MRITTITVAFNPDLMRLLQQLVALRDQVDEIIVIDNGSVPSLKSRLDQPEFAATLGSAAHIEIIALNENGGIASGFNVGVAAARKQGAEFVLLLDHDSVPAADMVTKLLTGYQQASGENATGGVAAVGPRIVDARDKHEFPFIRLGWFRNQHMRCTDHGAKIIACDFLISSGSLISMSAFDKIGGFDDALFIDSVDLEWCFRARSVQYSLYGVCDAKLDHRLGDHRRAVLNKIFLVVHSPLRIYYITRNRILLYWRPHVPLKWKLKDMLRMAAKFVAIMLFVAPRLEYLRMTLLAIRDGLANRGGRLRDRV